MTDQEIIDHMAAMGRAAHAHLVQVAIDCGYSPEEAEKMMSQPIHIRINGYCVACKGRCRE